MASKQPKADGEGFEALYKRLEESVTKLEEGGLTLEESLALYEDGMQLARRCQELLQEAELRITRLQESFTNGLTAIREEPAEYAPESEPEPEPTPDELPLE
jgi:exodeoxyribonuclease VII small subunit